MERGDLLKDNGKIFSECGKIMNDNASRNVKVLVVGNPANTNCLILSHHCKDIPKQNFTVFQNSFFFFNICSFFPFFFFK